MPETSPAPEQGASQDTSFSVPFGIAIVGALVGIVSVLFFDFGGWYERIPFGSQPIQRWHYIGLTENPVQFIVFAAVAVALAYSVYVAVTALRTKSYPPARALTNGLLLSGAASAVLLLVAIIFAAATLPDEPDDWWLDAGFYGGFVGATVTTAMFWLSRKNALKTAAAEAAAPGDRQ